MRLPDPILIVQTAFLGDVVLTLPLAQTLKRADPAVRVDMLVVPRAAGVVAGHPDIREALLFDKRGADRGAGGFLRTARRLRGRGYAAALVPHRSLRSALLPLAAGIPLRIGFDRSAGRRLFSRTMPHRPDLHEIDRNLELVRPLGLSPPAGMAPSVHAAEADRENVARLLEGIGSGRPTIAIAPGTPWNTKRWPGERFADAARLLLGRGFRIVLVGGAEDRALCDQIAAGSPDGEILNFAGELSIPESAELIRRSLLLLCNDSAPLHLAGAVGTPVLAIFGATVPAFGFGPRGPLDRVLETAGLPCRPCSIHGGRRCPVGTFECMLAIDPASVAEAAAGIAARVMEQGGGRRESR